MTEIDTQNPPQYVKVKSTFFVLNGAKFKRGEMLQFKKDQGVYFRDFARLGDSGVCLKRYADLLEPV